MNNLLAIISTLVCLIVFTHATSEIEKQCTENLEFLKEIVSPGHIEKTCQNRLAWLEKAADGKRNDFSPQAAKVSSAEMDFLKSLDPRTQVRGTNIPIRPPNAYPRKEYRMMTDDERRRFHFAVLVLKAIRVNELRSEYDSFVHVHTGEVAPGAHWGPCFYGWHREYLLRFERALQRVDSTVTIPYWDSTMDALLGDSAGDTMMWTEEFMGNKDGDVVTGPFAFFEMMNPTDNRYRLFRGNGMGHRLMDDGDLDYLINRKDNFRDLTWHIDPYFETVHGENHFWIGGVMGDVGNSPSDPSFYLHHAFVDLMWLEHQSRIYREFGRDSYVYPDRDDEEAYGVGELHDPRFPDSTIYNVTDSYHLYDYDMLPFEGLKNYDGLSDIYQLYYYYDERPSCSASQQSCGSPYLFCMELQDGYKCAPKLKPGANCTEFEEFDSCYSGRCDDGVCLFVEPPPTTVIPPNTTPNSASKIGFSLNVSILIVFVFSCVTPQQSRRNLLLI